tara:strand:- start:502 stop:1566 length:1065 start_codon:yes stop_codon:yes gene_type:complete
MSSPTQAEAIAAGMRQGKPQNMIERIKMGDKDMRSMLAEEKLDIAQQMVGGGYSREALVDMLNQNSAGGLSAGAAQFGDQFVAALNNDERVGKILELGDQGVFAVNRPEVESPNFVGEGQFGRVEELAPGYVVKKQAPLVEFGGYQDNIQMSDGLVVGNPRGNLQGYIADYRDVGDEVAQLNILSKSGISPGVEAFNIEPSGATEVIMKDLRDNYEGKADRMERIEEKANRSPKDEAQALKQAKMLQVKQNQQEAMAMLKGIQLQDRHEGNIMVHKMMDRPLQIDPSGTNIQGSDRDLAIAKSTVSGMHMAGLEQEADIFAGLINEAADRGDAAAVKDLSQQGMSRLMKIKKAI